MQKKDKTKEFIKFGNLVKRGEEWQNALPLGNGSLGALVACGATRDSVGFVLNNALIGGSVGVLPDVSDKFRDARAKILSNNPVIAGVNMESALVNKKYTPSEDCLMPLADLNVNILNKGRVTNYSRELSFSDEEVCTGFTLGKNKINRSCFVSHSGGLFYYEIIKQGEEELDVEVSLTAHDVTKKVCQGEFVNYEGEESEDQSINVSYYQKNIGNTVYGAVMRVLVDNKAVISVNKGKIRLENLERALIIVQPFTGKVKDKLVDKIKSELLAIRNISYEKAFKEHIEVYQKKWGKHDICLAEKKDGFVEEKIETDLGWVMEKLFFMAKYLAVNGFNLSTMQAFTSGLWGVYYGNKGNKVDTTAFLPALYSAFGVYGKQEFIKPVVDYILKYIDDTKKVSNRLFKCSGYQIPSGFVLGSLLPSKIDADSLSCVSGGASVANMLYDYFLYTKDLKFLKLEALPFMCGVADFYMSYFQPNAITGELESVPSMAFQGKVKAFENKSGVPEKNAVQDFVLVKALLNNIINAYNVYSVPVIKIIEYQNFLNKLPVKTFTKPTIKEFLNDESSERSGGFMHLYPVFETKEVNLYSTIEQVQSVVNYLKTVLEKNVSGFSSLALARILECLSVLGQKEMFAGLLEFIVKNYLSLNMLITNNDKFGLGEDYNKENEFNIAVNMVLAKSIISSFVMDYGNNICLLPCKITRLERGQISGVLTRQNVMVDVSYDDKKGSCSVIFKAVKASNFNLLLFKGVKKVKGYTIDPANPKIENITIAAGKSVSFDIKY